MDGWFVLSGVGGRVGDMWHGLAVVQAFMHCCGLGYFGLWEMII